MPTIFVTLDVSRLSGWLNADAPCRGSKGGHTMWCEVQSTGRWEMAGGRGASGAQGRARLRTGSRARGGAHVEHVGHVCDAGVREEVQSTGRREAAGDRGACAACRGGLDCRLGAGYGEERTKNMQYMSVTLDVSKLSGWLNAYAVCQVGCRAYKAGRGAGRKVGGRGGGSSASARRMGKNRLEGWGAKGHAQSAPQTSTACP
eukprot:scaffold76209_cov58-Phaeocystis_antarctica.AAC.2